MAEEERSSEPTPHKRDVLAAMLLPLLPSAFAAPAVAAETDRAANPRAMVRLHAEGQAAQAARLADVAWLQGHWIGDMPEGPVENVFLAPSFGQMPAFVRAINARGIIFYEIATFVEVGDSLSIRLKHFTPELAGWEAQDAYLERPLVARDANALYFHRSTYLRTGPDSYTVYFLNMNADGEELETLVIPFRRA